MAEVLFRPAQRTDAIALAALVDIAGEGMPSHLWSGMKAPGQSLLEFGRSRAQRDTGGFSWRNGTVAEIDGEVAACLIDYRLDDPYDTGNLDELPPFVRPMVRLEAKAPGSWFVNVLAAFPEFRGHGLGARLLAVAEGRARENNARELSLVVAGENESAVRLYGRTGYRETARTPLVTYPGCARGGDLVLMVKRASP